MIKRSLLFAVLLLVGYDLCVRLPQIRDRFIPQSQWQENIVRAQEFVRSGKPPPNVIVGSSLSARLSAGDLGPLYANLAFSGGSALTGLELVSRGPTGVKTVFIESNLVFRPIDAPVIANVFRPVFFELRQYLPSLREKYQPAGFLAGKAGEKVISAMLLPLDRFVLKPPARGGAEELFSRLLADQQAGYNARVAGDVLNAGLDELAQKIAQLQRSGIQCVFLEMPIDRSLTHLPLAEQVRDAMKQRFPAGQYAWISPDPARAYATTDGLHLTGDEARAFAHRIQNSSRGEVGR